MNNQEAGIFSAETPGRAARLPGSDHRLPAWPGSARPAQVPDPRGDRGRPAGAGSGVLGKEEPNPGSHARVRRRGVCGERSVSGEVGL